MLIRRNSVIKDTAVTEESPEERMPSAASITAWTVDRCHRREGEEWVPKPRSVSLSPVIQVAVMTKISEMRKEYRREDLNQR